MKKKFNLNKKSIALSLATLGVLGVLSAGSFMAYLTDTDTKTNTFTIGKVDIELKEDAFKSDNAQNVVPNQVIAKNPVVTNTGKNKAVAFVTVEIPIAELTKVQDDGTKATAAALTQIFQTGVKNASTGGDDANTTISYTWADDKVDETNWILLSTEYQNSNGAAVTRDGEDPIPSGAAKVIRTYGYKKVLKPGDAATSTQGDSTTAIFDAVKLVNVTEAAAYDKTTQNIVINAYAIQAENINVEGVDTSKDPLTKEILEKVYAVYVKQNPKSQA